MAGTNDAQLLDAMNRLLSPTSSQAEKQKAFEVLEVWKKATACHAIIRVGHQLLTRPLLAPETTNAVEQAQNCMMQLYGLQLLEEMVKLRWEDLNRNERLDFRNQIIGFGTQQPQFFTTVYRVRFVRILADIIVREWPQCWPTMLADLATLAARDADHLEFVMRVYSRVLEEAMILKNVPKTRSKQVSDTLHFQMNQILLQSEGFLKSSVALNNPSTIKSALELLGMVFEVVQMEELYRFNVGIIDNVFECLITQPALLETSAETLQKLISRQHAKAEEYDRMLNLFLSKSRFEKLTQIFASPIPENDVMLAGAIKIAEILSYICERVQKVKDIKVFVKNQLAMMTIMQDLLVNYLLGSRSLTVVGHAVNALFAVWKCRPWAEESFVQESGPVLANRLFVMLSTLDDREMSPLDLMDFMNDDVEYIKHMSTLKMKICYLVHEIAVSSKQQREAIFNIVFQNIHQLMTTKNPSKTPWYAVKQFIEHGVKCMPAAERQQHQPVALQVLNALLQWDFLADVGALSASNCLSCVSRLVQAFTSTSTEADKAMSADVLLEVVKKTFDLYHQCLAPSTLKPAEGSAAILARGIVEENWKDLRLHALNLLQQLCKQKGAVLNLRFEPVKDGLVQLLQHPALLVNDQCQLMDCIIWLTEQRRDTVLAEQLKQLTLNIMTPFWLNDDVKKALQDINAFIHFFGFHLPDLGDEVEPFASRRIELLRSITILDSLLRFRTYCDRAVLPYVNSVFLLLQQLSKCHQPQFASMLGAQAQSTLRNMPETYRNELLTPVFGNQVPPPVQPLPPNTARLCNWLHTIFVKSLHALSNMALSLPTDFFTSSILNYILQVLLQQRVTDGSAALDVAASGNFPLHELISVLDNLLIPLIYSIPPDKTTYESFLVPLVRSTCLLYMNILGRAWSQPPTSFASEMDEIVSSLTLRHATNQFVRLYLKVIVFHSDDNKKGPRHRGASAVLNALASAGDAAKAPTGGFDVAMSETNVDLNGDAGDNTNDAEDGDDDDNAGGRGGAGAAGRRDPNTPYVLGTLPQTILQSREAGGVLMLTIFYSMTFDESRAVHAAISCADVILPSCASNKTDLKINEPHMREMLQCMHAAFHLHGNTESLRGPLVGVLFELYKTFRKQHYGVFRVVLTTKASNKEKVESLMDSLERLFLTEDESKKSPDKKKRELVKSLVDNWIGKPVTERGKLEVRFPSLPSLKLIKKEKASSQNGDESLDVLSNLFAS